jgi:Lrp/AsnC family transcriptional regulator
MILNDFKLDEVDVEIINSLQEDPYLTYSEIASRVNRSQPTVGARIKKLRKKGILTLRPGINFKKIKMTTVFVNIKTKNPDLILEMANSCPYILNAFKIGGPYNIAIMLASTDLKKLNDAVNYHFRANPAVQSVSMNIITNIAKDFIVPINLNSEVFNPTLKRGCDANCRYCKLKSLAKHYP